MSQTVAAVFLKQQLDVEAMSVNGAPLKALRLLLLPGHVWREAWQGGDRGMHELHESALEIAADHSSWWSKVQRHDVLLASSSFCIFGAIASLLARRMHFLSIVGLLLFGASMMMNSHVPSVQYLLCCALAMHDVASRSHWAEDHDPHNELQGQDQGHGTPQ